MAAEIKPYDASMQQDINCFYKKCFEALGWDYEPSGRHADTVNIPEEYLKTGRFWCLYDGESLVGTIALRVIDPFNQIAELKRLYVLPERQGEGLGSLLFETALRFAGDAGFKTIRADTRSDRFASQHLMRKHGFKETSQYNENPFAEMFFELDLSAEKDIIFR